MEINLEFVAQLNILEFFGLFVIWLDRSCFLKIELGLVSGALLRRKTFVASIS